MKILKSNNNLKSNNSLKPNNNGSKNGSKKGVVLFWLWLICMMIMPATAAPSMFSKAGEADTTASENAELKDPFGRDTPRGTVQGFLSALSSEDDELSAKYLDDAYLSKKGVDSKEVVDNFRQNLDVSGRLYPIIQINDTQTGSLDDLMPTDKEQVGVIGIKGDTDIDVLLTQKKAKDGTVYWQFAKDTLEQLPTSVDTPPTFMEKFQIEKLKDWHFFGHSLSDIVVLLYLIAISTALVYMVVWVVFWLVKVLYPLVVRRNFPITPKVVTPLTIVLVAILLTEIMLWAGVPVTLRTPVERLKEATAWLATAWLVLRVIDVVFYRAERLSVSKNRPEQISLLGLLRKLAKAFMVIVAIIIIFGNLGFDLTTGIAALGVGGLALAFGAQKTIENLIGSVVVVADRPVNIGDYCKFGTYEGVVIDVGIRSTRVRTLNRTVVTIPNGDFSSLQIENYATRDMFHFLHHLYIKRHTDLDKLDKLIIHLKEFLDNHSDVNDEWTQVRISELRQDAFVLEVRAYIITTDVVEFYDKQTKLLLEVLQQVQDFGVEYALPSQEVHITAKKTDKENEQ